MDLSMKWLSDYVDLNGIDIKKFCHEMTNERFKGRRLY